jgi:hypothetical protein
MDRLRELELIPSKQRTPEERREYQKLATRKSRSKTQFNDGRLAKIAAAAESLEEFWQANRREVDEGLMAGWLAQQERVQDQLYWLNFGWRLPLDDPDFLSLAEGTDDLDDFIEDHGFIRDAYKFRSDVLNDFQPGWAIWADENFGDLKPYWKRPKVLKALMEENDATRVFCLYGIRIGLPEYHVIRWRNRVAEHNQGFPTDWHRKEESADCYVCRFELARRQETEEKK